MKPMYISLKGQYFETGQYFANFQSAEMCKAYNVFTVALVLLVHNGFFGSKFCNKRMLITICRYEANLVIAGLGIG